MIFLNIFLNLKPKHIKGIVQTEKKQDKPTCE